MDQLVPLVAGHQPRPERQPAAGVAARGVAMAT